MSDSGYGCMNCKHWGDFYGREHGICRGLGCNVRITDGIDEGHKRFMAAYHAASLVTHADFFCNGWEWRRNEGS